MTDLFKHSLLSNQIFRHVLYWFGLILFFGVIWGTYDNDYIRSFTIQSFALPSRMVLVYVSLYILIPHFFLKRRFLLFALYYVVLLLTVAICIQRPIMVYYVQPNYFPDWISLGYFNIVEMMNTILDINHAAIVPLGIVFIKYYYEAQQHALNLEKEKLQTELIQLRNQIHPHFLFNTLNSLYSLIMKKSDAAEDAVLRLSGLMRYMLYEANVSRVPLSKELTYLKNYVDLEKLRLENSDNISFTSQMDKEYEIAPFILIPFIENAFKHGTNNNKVAWIIINISVKDGQLSMQIANENRAENGGTNRHGLGYATAKKRLDILYPEKYILDMEENELSYEVTFILNLV